MLLLIELRFVLKYHTFFPNFYFTHVFPPVYGFRQRGKVDLRLENGPGAVTFTD